MKAVLFNIHDITLIITIIACALLGSRHIGGWRRPRRSGYLFGLFLAANALVAINALFLWAEPIRHPVFSALPYLYLFLGAAGFLLGPLLYWQLRAHLDPEFCLHPKHYLHLLPALLALVYLYVECFRFPHDVQRDLLLNLQLYQRPNAFYGDFMTLKKLLPVAYGLLCLGLIQRQADNSTCRPTDATVKQDQLYVVGGFTTIWLWAGITHFVGTLQPGDTSDVMGITGNYLKLALIVFLIYRGAPRPSRAFRSPDAAEHESEAPIDKAHVERITRAMSRDKAFLNSQLTLERFSDAVRCPPREVSAIINRHFHQNFHEFVSEYRINEVKRHLRDPQYNARTISDIAQSAGFNSKATFHRLFRKTEATTPSHYRRKHQAVPNGMPASSHTA